MFVLGQAVQAGLAVRRPLTDGTVAETDYRDQTNFEDRAAQRARAKSPKPRQQIHVWAEGHMYVREDPREGVW